MADLKPYTNYRCHACRSTIWTGAYKRPGDRCMCGSTLVEEAKSGSRWRVRWEHVSPLSFPEAYDGAGRVRSGITAESVPNEVWTAPAREHVSEAAAREQYEGLLTLAAAGELIRNVRLEAAHEPKWELVTDA